MNKILLAAALSLLSLNAFATKARMTALANSFQLADTSTFYGNAMQLNSLGNFVTFETGFVNTTTKNNAEGIISYALSDSNRIAVALGHNDDTVQTGRAFMNSIVGAGTYSVSQNPLHLFYAFKSNDTLYSLGSFYSNMDNKLAGLTESSSGFVVAVKNGGATVYLDYGLVNSVEAAGGKKFDGAGYARLAGRYSADDMSYGADLYSWGAKSSTAGVEDQSYGVQTLMVRMVKSDKMQDGSQVFYGVQAISNTVNCKVAAGVDCTTKFTRTYLPVWVGVEANATDWLVFRGSVIQSAVLDSTKDDIGLPASATSGVSGATGAVADFSSSPNNTIVAAGLGLKYKDILVDGTLQGAANQTLNSANFLAQLGMTYKF